jgi:hypothetical protein
VSAWLQLAASSMGSMGEKGNCNECTFDYSMHSVMNDELHDVKLQ